MGTGGGDRLILGEDDAADEVRLGGGEVRGTSPAADGLLGQLVPSDVGGDEEEDDDDDAEELLRRLREQNERSWSRCPPYSPRPRPAASTLHPLPLECAAAENF